MLADLLRTDEASRVVLYVDQFEELFTQTLEENERTQFIEILLTAVTEPRGPLFALLSLRADFYDRLMAFPRFFRLMQASQVPVLPMEYRELRDSIKKPASLPDVQLQFEDDLVGELLSEMHGQSGALPLLQFTMDRLFEKRVGHLLTLSAYHEMGGVQGALTRHVEATYEALPTKEHRELARNLFLRLIDPGQSEQDTTRRRARLSEFERSASTQTKLLRETMDAFVAARLLTTNEHAGEATIEVSHEALIHEWPLLRTWLREAREDILLQQRISEDAVEWQQRHRPNDHLYRGSQLREARAWAKRNTLSQQEEIFLRASGKQRVRFFINMVSLLFLLFITTGIAFWIRFSYPPQPPNPTLVTTLRNDGTGSLRWTIDNASTGSTITFAPSLAGKTITLTDTLTIPNKQLRIIGPDARKITISDTKYGIAVDVGASISIINLIFTGGSSNSAPLLTNEGILVLTNSTVLGNAPVLGVGGGSGGGIYNKNGRLMLTNSTVSGNTSPGGGGGIYSFEGSLTLTNSTISGNTSVVGEGGGIFDIGGDMILTNSTISGNTSEVSDGGGGIFIWDGSLALTNSTVSGNTSYNNGGGILNEGSTVKLAFCTLYGNHAKTGGGLLTEDDQFPSLSQPESGISIMSTSLVADNQAPKDPDIAGHLTSDGYNLIQRTAGITFVESASTDHTDIPLAQIKINPNLQLNESTTTQTHALQPGSPAIDAIPPAACVDSYGAPTTTDQRGVKRPQGSRCDIGAYEYQP